AHALCRLHAVRLQPFERLGRDVVGAHVLAALRRQMTTDGLSHDAHPDEADHLFSLPVQDYTDAAARYLGDRHPCSPGPAALVAVALARGDRARRELAARRARGHGGRLARAGAAAARYSRADRRRDRLGG